MFSNASAYLFYGFTSFIFCFFLPGSLLLRIFKVRENFSSTILLAVPLSLIFNYCAVFILTLTGLYQTTLFRLLVSAVFLVWIRYSFRKTERDLFIEDWEFTLVESVLLLVSAITIFYFITRWIKSFGTIMDSWDVVFSWDKWAKVWFTSKLPQGTLQYPQLLPILYSVNYQLSGSDSLQFAAKIIGTVFPILGACALFSLGLLERRFRVFSFSAAVLFVLIINRLVLPLTGLADAPVASLLCIVICWCFICAWKIGQIEKLGGLAAGLVVGLSCLMKGSALPYIFIYPFLVCALSPHKVEFKSLLKGWMLCLVMVFSWYGFIQYRIYSGTEISAMKQLNAAIGVQNYFDRPMHACYIAYRALFHRFDSEFLNLTLCFSSVLSVTASFIYFRKSYALICGALLIFTVWSLTSSYDTRNFAPAAPLLAILPFLWTLSFVPKTTSHLFKLNVLFKPNFKWGQVLVGVGSLVTLVAMGFTDETALAEKQKRSMMRLEVPQVNEALYKYQSEVGFIGKIATAYTVVSVLPDLRHLYSALGCSISANPEFPIDVKYFLLAGYCGGEEIANSKALVISHRFSEIFNVNGYILYKIL